MGICNVCKSQIPDNIPACPVCGAIQPQTQGMQFNSAPQQPMGQPQQMPGSQPQFGQQMPGSQPQFGQQPQQPGMSQQSGMPQPGVNLQQPDDPFSV